MRKAFFYLRHIAFMSMRNRIRMALMSAGIFLAVAVFSVGIILSDSYYRGKLAVVEEMSDFVVTTLPQYTLEPEEAIREIAKVTPVEPVEEVYVRQERRLTEFMLDDVHNFFLMGQLHGITTTEYVLPVATEELFLPVESHLVEGRHLTVQDSNRRAAVAVIDELAAQILFCGESAVGKHMYIGSGSGSWDPEAGEYRKDEKEVEVVGVVRSSAKTKNEKYRLRKALDEMEPTYLKEGENRGSDGSILPITAYVQVYLPKGTVEAWYGEELAIIPQCYQMYCYGDKESFENGREAIGYVQKNLEKKGQGISVWTKRYWLEYYSSQLESTRRILNGITLFLCVISGLNIMSISFFAVKERIPEIGIRKAFGAGRVDIVFQVIFEMAIVAFFVSATAVCLSYYSCKLAEDVLSERFYTAFTVRLSNGRLVQPVLIGMLETLCSSLLPALYAARIKVTDALRFE